MGEGYVFTGVCLSTGGLPLEERDLPLEGGWSLPLEGVLPGGGRPPAAEILSTSGQYASYWNVFLF